MTCLPSTLQSAGLWLSVPESPACPPAGFGPRSPWARCRSTNSRSGGSSWLRWNIKFYFFAGRPPIRLATAAAERRLWVHAHQRRPGILPGGVRVGGVGYPWPLLARAGKQTFAFHLVVCTAVQHETAQTSRRPSRVDDERRQRIRLEHRLANVHPIPLAHDTTALDTKPPAPDRLPLRAAPHHLPSPPIASPIVR
ncbi:hypothetical protein ACCO45_006570 [Purpureocillium lilacinum]|uniref:Uncharacterized protein n=1 Tax=Purpureocillium lilacinum TaxID=33203 RepID=A0ACC4DQL9_PURLI